MRTDLRSDIKKMAGLATGLLICSFVFGLDNDVVYALGLGIIGGMMVERYEGDGE